MKQVDAGLQNGWHAWERQKRGKSGLGEPVEIMVGGVPENFLRYVRFERSARGLDTGHRSLLADKIAELAHIRFSSPGSAVPFAHFADLHRLAVELQLSRTEILDLIQSAPRLKMAARGWVAEAHLVRQLADAFLLGGRRRRAAIRELVGAADPAGVAVLAEALPRHPKPEEILRALRQLAPEQDGEKVEALWGHFAERPTAGVGEVLTELGWPPQRAIPPKLRRDLLAVATEGAAREVIQAVTAFARALPVDDEAVNDAIYAAWARTRSDELARLISEQGRQPATPALEALHALVGGDLERYAALEDAAGSLLIQAFDMAPEPFRARIAQAVAASPDRAVKDAYRRAIAGGVVDRGQALENLKRVGDEDGLFEQVRNLSLLETLGLCERWAANPGRPSQPAQRAAVDRAVDAYRTLGQFHVESGPASPDGIVNIFEYWRAESPSDADLRTDLDADEPLRRARGLYLGHERGLVDAKRLTDAAKSEHWPARPIARLLDPAALTGAKEDHVLWVNACAGDASLLHAPIGGSPEDYARHSAHLEAASSVAAGRTQALLGILCAFQGVFVAGGITLDDAGEATDSGGVELEEAGDVQF